MQQNTPDMTNSFVGIVTSMLQNPPDPNEPIPFSNKKSTIYGVTIPFHVRIWATTGHLLY